MQHQEAASWKLDAKYELIFFTLYNYPIVANVCLLFYCFFFCPSEAEKLTFCVAFHFQDGLQENSREIKCDTLNLILFIIMHYSSAITS